MNLVVAIAFLASSASIPEQSTVRLKLKLREDETVRYRHLLNVTTYAPDGITERVSGTIFSFTFGEEANGRIPVSSRVESYESLEPVGPDTSPTMGRVEVQFTTDVQGATAGFTHTAPIAALEPVGVLTEKTLRGICAFGLLGVSVPSESVSSGQKWERKTSATEFFSAVLGPAGEMFQVSGDVTAVFTLVDFVNVNKKRHARISMKATGTVPIEIHSPEADLEGKMVVSSDAEIYIDLETGLLALSRTDTSASIDLGEIDITLSVQETIYRQ